MLSIARKVKASGVTKTKTPAARVVAPNENRRNSTRLSGNSSVSETTNSRGMNQAQITAERLQFAAIEQAERNIDKNADKNTDRDDEQSEGTQSEEDNHDDERDDSSEEKTPEEIVAKTNASRINSRREIQLQKG